MKWWREQGYESLEAWRTGHVYVSTGRPALPPTCQKCGGLSHEAGWHNLVPWNEIAQRHAAELRALADDLRRNEEHIAQTSARGIARGSRADAYEWVAGRLEKDAEEMA